MPDLLIGRAPIFLESLELINRVAQYDVPVVVEGETGTGKELAARAIHYGSARRDAAFVPVNCGAIPDTLIESELFGHERGAFTDARSTLQGLIDVANRGTLFLDEIDSLSPHAQVTLLRFLQDHRYRPIGGRVDRQSDVRVVAASNRSLEALVTAGVFRADLLFRLNLMYVKLPPLRERKGDAALLAAHFTDAMNRRYRHQMKRITPALTTWLEAQPWPGNVRELEYFIHRRYLLSETADIDPRPRDAASGDSHPDGSIDDEPSLPHRQGGSAGRVRSRLPSRTPQPHGREHHRRGTPRVERAPHAGPHGLASTGFALLCSRVPRGREGAGATGAGRARAAPATRPARLRDFSSISRLPVRARVLRSSPACPRDAITFTWTT